MPRNAFNFAVRVSCLTALCVFESVEAAYAQDGRTAGAIEEEFNRSVVRILVSGRNAMGNDAGTTYGTGIFIDDGVILTAGHVVGRDEDWYSSGGRLDRHVDVFRLNEGEHDEKLASDARVMRGPVDVDLALIFLNRAATNLPELSFETPDARPVVFAYVWDKAEKTPSVRQARIVRTDVLTSGPGVRLEGTFREGQSGSPVFDQQHRAFAIVVKGDDNDKSYTLALPITQARPLLATLPHLPNFRRYRAEQRETVSDPKLRDSVENATIIKIKAEIRQQAAETVGDYLRHLGFPTDRNTATLIADDQLKITVKQENVIRDGAPEILTSGVGQMNMAGIEAAVKTRMALISNVTTEAAQQAAREREQQLLKEIDDLKAKLAAVSNGNPAVAATIKQSDADELQAKASQLSTNSLLLKALVAKSLGRGKQATQILDESILQFPDFDEARLERRSAEDFDYLVKKQSKVSIQPYYSVAQRLFAEAKYDEAVSLLKRVRILFPDVIIVDLYVKTADPRFDIKVFYQSLTMEWDDGYTPPGTTATRMLVREREVFLLESTGDYRKTGDMRIRFSHYGYNQCLVTISRSDLRPGEFAQGSCDLRPNETKPVGVSISGIVKFTDRNTHEGATAELVGEQKTPVFGLNRSVITRADGRFGFSDLPDGDYELLLHHPDYVAESIFPTVRNEKLTCRYPPGCDIDKALDIKLYRIRTVRVRWVLQEMPGSPMFDNGTATGEATLRASAPSDWRRFSAPGTQSRLQIDPPYPADMVFYTDSNGRIFFGQPSTYKDFITRVDVAFDKLLSAASIPAMQATEEVTAGTTYVLKTNGAKKNSPIFYVKLQVLSIN